MDQRPDDRVVRFRLAVTAALRARGSLGYHVLLLSIVFALLRTWALVGSSPVRTFDSAGYFPISFTGDAIRLWTVPVMYRALPGDGTRVLAQLALACICWSALAFALAFSLRHPLVARTAAGSVLLLGLCGQITQWDPFIGSDSVALSLTALLIALLLLVRIRPEARVKFAAFSVLVLWVFTRELHAATFIWVCMLVVLWMLVRRRRRVLVTVALVALALWGAYAATRNDVIVADNVHGLLVIRIFQEQEGVQFFADRGMPQIGVLKREADSRQWLGRRAPVLDDEAWKTWVDDRWFATYARWLLHDPLRTVRQPLGNLTTAVSGFPGWKSSTPVLPSPVQDFFWDRSRGDVPFLTGLALLGWLASMRKRRMDNLDACGLALVGTSVGWYFTAWHLNAAQLERILVPPGAALRIGLLIVFFASLDRLVGGGDEAAIAHGRETPAGRDSRLSGPRWLRLRRGDAARYSESTSTLG